MVKYDKNRWEYTIVFGSTTDIWGSSVDAVAAIGTAKVQTFIDVLIQHSIWVLLCVVVDAVVAVVVVWVAPGVTTIPVVVSF